METRICKTCQQEKQPTDFNKSSDRKDGLAVDCKPCQRIKRQNYNLATGYANYKRYEKTKPGFLMRMYRNMQSRITGVQWMKKHLYEGKYLLSREEFYKWANESTAFHNLFAVYESLGYDRKRAPSVDRIDSSKGYTLDNMEWVTHSENSRRGSISKNKCRAK